MTQHWCGICVDYTPHDTAHHDSDGGKKPGDSVVLADPPDEYAHLKGKRGRVESIRGKALTVAIPTSGGTVSLQVDEDAVT